MADSVEKQPSAELAFVNAILHTAIEQRASDIHLDPVEEMPTRIRLRIDGVLHDLEPDAAGLPLRQEHASLVHQVKALAGMDRAETRLPQDGRMQLNVGGKRYDLAVSVLPTVAGERVVMRVLPRDAVCLDLEKIGLEGEDLTAVRRLLHVPNGIVICAGPVGSGKTTLLYAMLMETDRDRCSVVSVEDPVEYRLPGVAQTEVRPQIGFTFARAVRQVLRQDPDIILIGEIRDTEVADLTASCALTGHLVLTTLPADSAPQAIRRLLDFELPAYVVSASLAGVIAQRLVRLLCPECRQPVKPAPESLPRAARSLVESLKSPSFFAPRGCDQCHNTGYRGRTAIHEILVANERLREAIASGGGETAIRQAAVASGMRTLLACGVERAARGITSLEEVLSIVPHGVDR
jgi:general secretion pathway protein E